MREPTAIMDAVEQACARIAPTWPLDRFIAVNPFWALTGEPLPEVAQPFDAARFAHEREAVPS